jgi:hypothetical protein
MTANSSFQILLDGNAWSSTISFDSGIPVTLAGMLDVRLADGVDPASLRWVPIQLFDWTTVAPSGHFTWEDNLPAGYRWDTSHLYDTGVIMAIPEPATLSLLALGTLVLNRHRKRL